MVYLERQSANDRVRNTLRRQNAQSARSAGCLLYFPSQKVPLPVEQKPCLEPRSPAASLTLTFSIGDDAVAGVRSASGDRISKR